MDFYNPQQLSEIYGGWNPETYMQGRAQVESSNVSQGAARQQDIEKAKQAGLETLFQEQNNPTRVQQGQANLQGTLYDNMSKGVAGRLAEATEPFKLDEAKRQQALAMPEHEIKMMQAKGQNWAMSDDPVLAAKGKAILQKSAAAIEARQKHADEMEKQNLIRASAEKIAAGNNAAMLEAARLRAANAGKKAQSPQEVAAKLGYEKGAVYYTIQAENADTPEEADRFRALAKQFEEANVRAKGAAAQVGASVKPDLNQMGIPTVGAGAAPAKAPPAPPDGRVRVVSPDGKVGHIPANQLDAAVKAGYKKAQ